MTKPSSSKQPMFFFFFFFFDEVKDLIQDYLSEDEPLVVSEDRSNGFDIFLPAGCRRLLYPANTYVEIKEKLVPGTISESLQKCNRLKTDNKAVGLYVLVFKEDPYGLAKRDLFEKQGFHFKLVPSGSLSVHEAKSLSLIEDWKKQREVSLKKARIDFCAGKNTLFLGAGVSCSAGLPNWKGLLKRIIRNLNNKDDDRCLYEILDSESNGSPLIMARFIKNYIDEEESSYGNIVRQSLYKTSTQKSPLVKSIIDAVTTNKVEEIITYNYDDAIERAMDTINRRYSSVIDQNRPEKDAFPILHVHGFLPKDDDSYDRTLILSEDEYNLRSQDVYHWANIEQLHALTYTTCFFIGMSMNDPTLRRLLDISYQRGTKGALHYAFLPRSDHKDHFRTSSMFASMGVDVIWYDGYDELPSLIKFITTPYDGSNSL